MKRMFGFLLVAALISGVTRYAVVRKGEVDFKQCQANLQQLCVAFEMYSTDNAGRYPRTTEELVPQYLAKLPVCPAAADGHYQFQSAISPDAFTVHCRGFNHWPQQKVEDRPVRFNESGHHER